MRKLVFVLALFLLLAAQIGQAADLQAGWYVKLGNVAVFGVDPNTRRETAIDWSFAGGLGSYGPFEVTSPGATYPQRVVTVPSTVNGAASGAYIDLTGMPDIPIGFTPNSLQFVYNTYYDVSQMRFDLFVRHSDGTIETLFSETRSGQHSGVPTVFLLGRYSPISDTLVFRTSVVPEPSSAITLAFSLAFIAGVRRRFRCFG